MSTMRWAKSITISQFECPKCHNKTPLPRRKSKPREKGHIKDLWCPTCKEITKHKEYRIHDYDQYIPEFVQAEPLPLNF